MTPDTPEHHEMPLTLVFSPEPLADPEDADATETIVIVQPSAREEGRIFLGSNPFGKAVGCHLLPEDALRVRDHLNKLLLEPGDDAPLPPEGAPGSFMQRRAADIARAAAPAVEGRIIRPKRRKRLKLSAPQFRLEFKWGAFEALLVRLGKRGS